MNETQIYLALSIPSFVALVGILVNVAFFVHLGNRIDRVEGRLDSRIDRLEGKFDLLIGKVIEIDNRLTRVEERLKLGH